MIDITTQWPTAPGQGSNQIPGGPYLTASSPGTTNTTPFASMACGDNSMIVQYSGYNTGPIAATSGPVSVIKSKSDKSLVIVIVGSAASRRIVTQHFA